MPKKRAETPAIKAETLPAEPDAYQALILQATGCCTSDAAMLEDIMRNEAFHSTLDWQTRSELESGARKAHLMLTENRAGYEKYARTARAAFLRMKQGSIKLEEMRAETTDANPVG